MRAVRLAAVSIAVGALTLVAVACWLQRDLIYFPDRASPPPAASVLPGAEEVSFVTGDGVRLGGWFVPARGQSRGTVIVFNGNAGNRSHRADLAAALAEEELAVLLFDYRGYAGNPGSPSEAGLFADARAARSYLVSRRDVDPARLVYYGESLGTAVAVGLAAEQPPAALILRSPFPSMAEVGRRHVWFLPVDLLLMDRYPAAEWIRRVPVPTLVFAGSGDQLIPPEMSRQVFDAAPGPKQFILVPGVDHADPRLATGPEVIGALRQVLQGALGR